MRSSTFFELYFELGPGAMPAGVGLVCIMPKVIMSRTVLQRLPGRLSVLNCLIDFKRSQKIKR